MSESTAATSLKIRLRFSSSSSSSASPSASPSASLSASPSPSTISPSPSHSRNSLSLSSIVPSSTPIRSQKNEERRREREEERPRKRARVTTGGGFGGGEEEEDSSDFLPYTKDSLLVRFDTEVEVEKGNAKATEKRGEKREEKRPFDFSSFALQSDHEHRPLWTMPNGHMFLETFSPIYKQAYDFMIAIAEPVCRPQHVHEYRLTRDSLCAAVSMSIPTQSIVDTLIRLSKNEVPQQVKDFIIEDTSRYGKLRLVLQSNGYFVESQDISVLKYLLEDPAIRECRRKGGSKNEEKSKASDDFRVTAAPENVTMSAAGTLHSSSLAQDLLSEYDTDDLMDMRDTSAGVLHSFELLPQKVEDARRLCREKGYPMLQEYDFRNDSVNPNLAIDLKPSTLIREYQEKSLSKMFGNGRARSGIIVLPCGAGKSLVGITACCTIKKTALVLCISAVSVEQWKQQFRQWTTVSESKISRFTAQSKELDDNDNLNPIVITTYTMVAYTGNRSEKAEAVMKKLQEREWGIMVLDEVHVVPAEMFRKVLTVTRAHCKLGLTATLVREDDKIKDLHYLLGPKLYEANWLDLQRSGHLARVQCAEVWCPMTAEYFEEFQKTDKMARKMLLCVMNPNKMRACEFLIRFHEERGDKIIVFSDCITSLELYAPKFKKPYIYGKTSQDERLRVIRKFKHDPTVNTFFISKVGDTAIDLPEANVIIQISSHFGSRRQEAQRLGRILRPKAKTSGEEYNAFFYSLVSRDTQEMYFSTKRQKFLVDQGYSFKVLTNLEDFGDFQSTVSKEDERNILSRILEIDDEQDEKLPEDADYKYLKEKNDTKVKRRSIQLSDLSGGGGRSLSEKTSTPKVATDMMVAVRRKMSKQKRDEAKRQQSFVLGND